MKPRTLISLHQKIGLTAIIVVIMLSATGIALNHTESLQLKKTGVSQAWLYEWYGLALPEFKTSHHIPATEMSSDTWVTQFDRDIWINEQKFAQGQLQFAGATHYGFAIVTSEKTLLVTPELELIDQLANPSGSIEAAIQINPLTLKLNDQTHWQLNEALTTWVQTSSTLALSDNSNTRELPSALKKVIEEHYSSLGLNWERVLLDLHSGRIFGPLGVWIIDLFAVLLIVLSVSGYYMYRNKRPRRRCKKANCSTSAPKNR